MNKPHSTEMFPTTMEKYTYPTEKDDFTTTVKDDFETTTIITKTTEDFFGFGSEDFQSDENCPTSCTE